MRAEDIAGLTAEQIKDKYALQYVPKYICDVSVPSGTNLRTGIAGAIDGWGNGGGVQFEFMMNRVGTFTNIRSF